MSHGPRVALIIGQLHAGGSERQLFELATRLKGGRCQPYVYCLSQVVEPLGPRLSSAGVPLRILPRRRSYELRRLLTLARQLEQDRIDVVHSLSLKTNLYAWLALLRAGRRPFATSNRATDPTCSRALAAVHRRVMLQSRVVVVNSHAGLTFTNRFFRIPAERVRVIHNGVDLSRFENLAEPSATRAALGVEPGVPLIGLVGRISWEKGVDRFLEMAELVSREIRETRFLLVGDGPLRVALEQRARSLGLGGSVIFTGDRDDVPDLLAAMDLLTLTSSQEGLPNTVMEAMAARRPVVATDVGGCRELVEDGVTGYLAPPEDPRALASQVLKILRAPDAGRAFGTAGRRRIESDFEVGVMARRFEDLYCRLHQERLM